MNGLNGWFGRFLKSVIVRVATLVDTAITLNTATFVDSNFTEYANSIGSGGGSFWNRETAGDYSLYNDTLASIENDPRAAYEPTLSEEAILNKFSEAFSNVITNLATIAGSIKNTPFNQEKIQIVNELLQRFSVIKRFYQINEKEGLSTPAVDLRNLIVEVLILKIETDISIEMAKDKSLSLLSASVTINPKVLIGELYPLNRTSSISFGAKFQNYKLAKQLELPPDETPIQTLEPPPPPPNDPAPNLKPDSCSIFPWIITGVATLLALASRKKKENNN